MFAKKVAEKLTILALINVSLMLPVIANELPVSPEAQREPDGSQSDQNEAILLDKPDPALEVPESGEIDVELEPDKQAIRNHSLELDEIGLHTTFSVGYQGFNLQALNQPLALESYSAIAEQALSLGGSMQLRVFHLMTEFEGHVNLMVPSLNADYSLQPTSGLFFFNAGYIFKPHQNLTIYPLAGIGAAMLDLNFTQRGPQLSFSDFLKNPGRQGAILNTMLAFNLGLGVDYMFDWLGLIGLRAGYVFTPWGSNWWTIDQLGSDDNTRQFPIGNGPTLSLAGPYLRINLGF